MAKLADMTTDQLWALYNGTPGTPKNEELLIAIEDELDGRDKRARAMTYLSRHGNITKAHEAHGYCRQCYTGVHEYPGGVTHTATVAEPHRPVPEWTCCGVHWNRPVDPVE